MMTSYYDLIMTPYLFQIASFSKPSSFGKILLLELTLKLLIFVKFSDVTEPHVQVERHVT